MNHLEECLGCYRITKTISNDSRYKKYPPLTQTYPFMNTNSSKQVDPLVESMNGSQQVATNSIEEINNSNSTTSSSSSGITKRYTPMASLSSSNTRGSSSPIVSGLEPHETEDETLESDHVPILHSTTISSSVASTTIGSSPHTETRRILLFQLSSLIGTLIFFVIYEILFLTIFEKSTFDDSVKSSLCWLLSYALSIWSQYELHCRIVFGKRTNSSEYWQTLSRTYIIYGISMFASTVLNYLLVAQLALDHNLVWFVTLIAVGVLNYFSVSRFAFGNELNLNGLGAASAGTTSSNNV
ncbi:hypothetical protein C9374_009466 [Naegleria lovaniensis]|uniref:GtrA/DPMS transmembrane domain-containing protein n=1 Tax=Naegleria lovaniensis TaxID=51637 RepID=A0AA88KRQ5_NAELO|nr:uncharacterized protein C9374_009466 [Naegleria lovaniensis]KAG2392889.1 hypothetical protein C9374_009466 [Naegleria lovaniensis]